MPRTQTKNGQPAIYNATPPTLSDGDGSALNVDSAGNLLTTVGVGTPSTSPNKVEDTPSANADVGIFELGIRNDAQTALSSTDGDYTGRVVDQFGNTTVVGGVASGSTDSGNPVKIGGRFNTTAPTLTNGQRGDVQLTNNGSVKVEQSFSYLNVPAGQATTVVKASAGFLHTITFNSAATATNVTTVYDNASGSGTIIAKPAATTATVPTTLTYDVSFANGLTIITTTANGSDMTVSFR